MNTISKIFARSIIGTLTAGSLLAAGTVTAQEKYP